MKDAATHPKVSADCFIRADEAEAEWLARVQSAPSQQKWYHAKAWEGFNREAGVRIPQEKNNLQ